MKSTTRQFSEAMVKIAKEKSDSYLNQMVYFAPAAALQSVVEIPKGSIDAAIENKIVEGKWHSPSAKSPLKQGIGRGLGRFAGALASTPLFMSGVNDLTTAKTKEERNKAFAKIIASGGIYAGAKGVGEAVALHGNPFKRAPGGGLSPGAKKALQQMKGLVTSRGLVGLGSSALTARAISNNIKSSKGEKGFYNDVVKPTLAGLGIGATKGGIESLLLEKGFKGRKFLGAAAGRGVSGAIGAVVLDRIAKSFTKKASAQDKNPFISPATIYSNVRSYAMYEKPDVLKTRYMQLSEDDPERSPTSRAVYYAMYDVLQHKGVDVKKPQLIDRVHKAENPDINKGAVLLAASYSPIVIQEAANLVPKGMHDKLMQDSLDNLIAAKKINQVTSGGVGDIGRYLVDSNTISVSSGASVATKAHELGHATAGKLRKELLQSASSLTAYNSGSVLAYLIPLGAMALASERSFATKEELEAKAKTVRAFGAITSAMTAPVILEEGIANVKGLNTVASLAKKNNIPVKKEVLRYLLRQGPRMLGYMSPLLAPALTAGYYEKRSKQL